MKKIIVAFCVLFCSITISAENKIRVLLSGGNQEITVSGNGRFFVKSSEEGRSFNNESFSVSWIDEKRILLNADTIEGGLRVTPINRMLFSTNRTGQNRYTGELIINPHPDGLRLIEKIDMEEYLYGVVPFEMSASWHIEALKVQAVTARTYAAQNLISPKGEDFDVFSSVMSQVYNGSGTVLYAANPNTFRNVIRAVNETRYQVLTYNGQMFATYYHSNCGGHTGPPVWNRPEDDITPLRGTYCGACLRAGHFSSRTWSHVFTNERIQQFVSTLHTDNSRQRLEQDSLAILERMSGRITNITPVSKTPDGRIIYLTITSESGDFVTVSCQDMRIGIGPGQLRSCIWDTVEKKRNGSFSFAGRGFGHGVGMCQFGARQLAEEGKTHYEILLFYYKGTEIIDHRKLTTVEEITVEEEITTD